MSRKRVIVVEDERDMAGLIAARLKREGYQVELAYDGQEAVKKIRADVPDAVLLDLMLPELSGTEVLRELRNDPRTAMVPVVILTAKSEEADVIVGLQLGADDYVTKPFSMSVLLARLEAVLRRASAGGAEGKALEVGIVRIDSQQHEVTVDQAAITLTKAEFRLLLALAVARGRVLTRDQLIDQAIGLNTVVTDRTIDVHLTALRRKLGKARNYIKTVRGIGYRMTDGDEPA
jgi:two-component system phosphate regulon response regulator PhoB